MTPETFPIRVATLDDHRAVESCVHAAFRAWVPLIGIKPLALTADYEAHIKRGTTYLVEGSSKDDLAGVLVYWQVDDALYVDILAVNPGYQKNGLGRRLLTFAEQKARELGLLKLKLVTNEKMVANQEYYKRFGYVETRRETFQPGRVGVWMAKILAAD